MKETQTYPLRLPRSLKAAVERLSREDQTSVNQFVATAVAEKVSALQTEQFFADRRRGSLGVIRPSARVDARRAAVRHNRDVSGAISIDPETMHGLPVFRGTRVPVQTLFEYLEGGDTLEDFLQGFPGVSRALALEVLEEAKRLLLARAS